MNKIYNEDCLNTLKRIKDNSLNMILTSPPYDNLRTYDCNIDEVWNDKKWKDIIKELYRVIVKGGVVVWIVNDSTIKGSETGTSFKQALYAKECGFRLHDTMIWNKNSSPYPVGSTARYRQSFEYMFIFSKGKPATFNCIQDVKSKHKELNRKHHTIRLKDGSLKKVRHHLTRDYIPRFNVWTMPPISSNKERCGHPAQMSIKLAIDHIKTWSNEDDIIYDPFTGSGTTIEACIKLNRRYLGSELNKKYYELANKRIDKINEQLTLF